MRIKYRDYLPQWEEYMLDPEQRAAVDRYQKTGEMPVKESLVKAVEDFKRQKNVIGRTWPRQWRPYASATTTCTAPRSFAFRASGDASSFS